MPAQRHAQARLLPRTSPESRFGRCGMGCSTCWYRGSSDSRSRRQISSKHLTRIAGGALYAASSTVPWATLLARTFDVDVKACVHCGGRLQVRAVVTDHDKAGDILSALPIRPLSARAPPSDTTVTVQFDEYDEEAALA